MVMKLLSKNSFLKTLILLFIPVLFFSGCTGVEQLTRLTTKPTPSAGPTIEQAQKEEYMGPKARVAVTRFEDRSAKGRITGQIGDGMAEMLTHTLFATNRYIVLERQYLEDVTREEDLATSGRARPEGAPPIGEIETADLLIRGTITEFEPGSAGGGAGAGGVVGGGGLGGLFGIRASHVALVITGIDARTSRRVFSEQVEGKAIDIGGLIGGFGGPLAAGLAGFAKTPMEKAIRVAIDEAVKIIVAKTPAEYYRASATSQPQTVPQQTTAPVPQQATPTTAPQQTPTASVTAPQPSLKTPGSEPRIVYVKWPKVSLREGPGTEFKSLLEIVKGTALAVLEEKGKWLRVSLEDGREGWIGKATTSETP
jgi:curli biogenesis system outer membrane secretion channel CsgG